MIKSNSVCSRIVFLLVGTIFCYLLAFNNAQAGELVDLQPAADIDYNERIRVESAISVARSSYFYGGVHIGETSGNGGVTFINGSIVNASAGQVPVTFGDDLRVDGGIWRGPNIGAGDGLPVKISDDLRVDGAIWGGTSRGNAVDGQSVVFADSVRPAMDNINTFGSSGFRWASGDFAGTVNVGNLGGNDVVNENNLQSTNAPTVGYILSYAGNNEFQWITSSDTLTSLSCTNGQVAKYNGTTWACGSDNDTIDTDWTGAGTGTMYATTTSDDIGIGITSGLNGKLHVLDSANDAGYFEATGDNVRAVRGVANNTTATTSYGGWFSANSTSGRGVHATVNGDTAQAVYGEATSTSALGNYGGYFTSASTTAGTGVYGSGYYGVHGTSSDYIAVLGNASGTGSGTNYGGFFTAARDNGMGVAGRSTGSSGIALQGLSTGASSTGVYGSAPAYGGNFIASGGAGYGVYARATDTTGINYGGFFKSDSASGYGAYIEATSGIGLYSTGLAYGGDFVATAGTGVHGLGTTYGGGFTASAGAGVQGGGTTYGGEFSATAGPAVFGLGTTYGGDFEASAGVGVDGEGTTYGGDFAASASDGKGVRGVALGATGFGVEGAGGGRGGNFTAENGVAVAAGAVIGIGVQGDGTTYGGDFSASAGRGVDGEGTSFGGDFTASDDTGYGVYGSVSHASGENYAGYFQTASTTNGYSGYFNEGNFKVVVTSDANSFTIAESDGTSGLPAGTYNDVHINAANGRLYDATLSSRRYKDNIQNYVVDTASVLQLQPVSFTYKNSGDESIGLIAEDVYEAVPDLVNLDKENKPDGVKYDRIPLYLLELAKEQQTTIENQEERISQLESIICKYLPQEEACQ